MTGLPDETASVDEIRRAYGVAASAAKNAGAASIWIIEDQLRDKVMAARKTSLTGAMLMGSSDQLTSAYLPHALISTVIGENIAGKKRNKITNH